MQRDDFAPSRSGGEGQRGVAALDRILYTLNACAMSGANPCDTVTTADYVTARAYVDAKLGSPSPGVDRRQPGGVPGAHPESAALVVDTTPEPAYRAPLEGTVPPAGREFRCASCGRGYAGHVIAGCPCGGEIIIVDPESDADPESELPVRHRIASVGYDGGAWIAKCECGLSARGSLVDAERSVVHHIALHVGNDSQTGSGESGSVDPQ